MNNNYSDYINTLKQNVRIRYLQKIFIIANHDPFTLNNSSKFLIKNEDLPKVGYWDIGIYFVKTKSFYTGEQLNSMKALNAYKYFEAGFVNNLLSFKIENFYVVTAKIRHSQKMNENLVEAWIILHPDGAISSAHCKCMAGLGEVCSHSAAIAFALYYMYSTDPTKEESCTDKQCVWNVPSGCKEIDFKKINDIHFGNPIRSKAYCDAENVEVPWTEKDTMNTLEELNDCNSYAGILSLVQPFAAERIPKVIENLPTPLNELFDPIKYGTYTLQQLQELDIDFSVTREEQIAVKKITLEQSKCFDWFKYKSGRLSSANFRKCCKTSLEKPALSLIKQVCYPGEVLSDNAHTDHGLKYENSARRSYEKSMKLKHTNFKLEQTGFVISLENPIFGVSPDGLINCQCCGDGLVEIKCPSRFVDKKMTLKKFSSLKNTYLIDKKDGNFTLNTDSDYFFQIQLQMFVLKRTFCDFIMWSPHEQIVFQERITFCSDFLENNLKKATLFHRNIIKPELLDRRYTELDSCKLSNYSDFYLDENEII